MYIYIYIYICVCVCVCVCIQHKMLCKSENTYLKQHSWIPSCSVRCAAIPSPYRIQRRFQCFVELSDFICNFDNASPAVPPSSLPLHIQKHGSSDIFSKVPILFCARKLRLPYSIVSWRLVSLSVDCVSSRMGSLSVTVQYSHHTRLVEQRFIHGSASWVNKYYSLQ